MDHNDWMLEDVAEAGLRAQARARLASRSWRWTAPLRRLADRVAGRPPEAPPVIASARDALVMLDGLDRSVWWNLAAPVRVIEKLVDRLGRRASIAPGPAPEEVDGAVLSADPLVVSLLRRPRPLAGVAALAPLLGERPALFLVHTAFAWLAGAAREAGDEYRAHRARHAAHEIVFLCNEPREIELLASAGVPVRLLNQNMFVNEDEWRILPDIAKRFDAVYNASLSPVKRHRLASGVASLALVYYVPNLPRASAHAESVRRLLAHAEFCNGPPSDYRWMPTGEVARVLNASRVGLCLSRVEGSMRASIEYLMCGLPVVTTPSLGGRDRYLDPEFCETVPADPESVAQAVRRLAARRIDPGHVREATLARVRQDRAAFFGLVQGFYDRHGASRRFEDDWPRVHRDYLVAWRRPAVPFLRDAGVIA